MSEMIRFLWGPLYGKRILGYFFLLFWNLSLTLLLIAINNGFIPCDKKITNFVQKLKNCSMKCLKEKQWHGIPKWELGKRIVALH